MDPTRNISLRTCHRLDRLRANNSLVHDANGPSLDHVPTALPPPTHLSMLCSRERFCAHGDGPRLGVDCAGAADAAAEAGAAGAAAPPLLGPYQTPDPPVPAPLPPVRIQRLCSEQRFSLLTITLQLRRRRRCCRRRCCLCTSRCCVASSASPSLRPWPLAPA